MLTLVGMRACHHWGKGGLVHGGRAGGLPLTRTEFMYARNATPFTPV
jgi:hypothetical protein